jgi:hypothetical protein
MSDELLTVLVRYHREIILPDIERVVARLINPRFDAIDGHFDAIYQRFERLETEYLAIKAAPEPNPCGARTRRGPTRSARCGASERLSKYNSPREESAE